MIHHVLVPLDGSRLAENALPVARQVLRNNGQVTLLMVTQDAPPLPEVLDSSDEQSDSMTDLPDSVVSAKEYLEKAGKNLQLQGYEVYMEMAGGEPADAIIRLAEDRRVDMVIMCSHGRSGLSRVLFGSVTLKVLEANAVPVLIVPSRERAEVPDAEIAPEPGINPAT